MISIVIPVLNEEKLLSGCLKSLREQDYQGEFEIIAVDNGSTDGTVLIAEEFGARVVYSGTKKNVFAARNVGAWEATGEIVLQADADTLYPRDWLTRMVRHFCDPEVVAVAGTFVYRDPNWFAKAEQGLRNLMNLCCQNVIGRPGVVSGANFAFRKEAFVKANGYDLRLYAPDQYGIATQLSRFGKVIYDRKTRVATSGRRNTKPAIVITRDFFRNVGRAFYHVATDHFAGRTKARKGPVLRLALIIPIIVALIIVAQGYFVPGSTVFGKVYSKVKTGDKVIALTFDDGPNDPYTSRILDILDSQDIKATFFVTGKNVQMYPETAKRIVAEGHDLGNHSYSHNANHALTAQGGKDVLLAEQAIYDVTGVLPRFYRPPHGKKSPWELYSIRHAGLTLVNWSIATNELHTTNFSAVAAQIVKKAKPGGIIDLHDGYGNDHGTPLADKTLAVKALPIIIEDLRKEGYSFVTVSELLGQSPYKVAQ